MTKSLGYLFFGLLTLLIVSCSPPENYLEINYDDLLVTVSSFVDDISTRTKTGQSDREAMSIMRDKLRQINMKTGLVSINSEMAAQGNLDYCIAVKTSDRDVVFLTIVPSDIDVVDETERLQFVYLEKGKKVGLIAAEFSASNSYEWYENYLEEVYEYYDFLEYLQAYSDTVEKNESSLDEIDHKNQQIINYIEDPPVMYQYLSDTDYDRINAEFARLIDLANARIDQYNNVYLEEFNEQVADFNNEISEAEELSTEYPDEIFYVEEYFKTRYTIEPPFLVPAPPSIIIPAPFYLAFYPDWDTFLSALSAMVEADDSYNQIPKPDRGQFECERVTDKNFTVKSFKINW